MNLRRVTLPGQVRQKQLSVQYLFDLISSASDDIKGLYDFLVEIKGISDTPKFGALSPVTYGITGKYIVADKDITSGYLFNYIENRPKTIYEALSDITKYIDGPLTGDTVNDVILLLKNRIGASLFATSEMYAEGATLDGRVALLSSQVKQIAADVFNAGKPIASELDETIYPVGASVGTQTKSLPIVDQLTKLFNAHGGLSKVNHAHLNRVHTLSSVIPASEFVEFGTSVNFVPFNGIQIQGTVPSFAIPLENEAYIKRIVIKVAGNSINTSSQVSLFINGIEKSVTIIAAGVNSTVISDNLNIKVNDLDEVYFNVDTTNASSGGIHIANITISINEQIEG